MRFIEINSNKYKARLVAKRYVKRTSTPIPVDVLAFLRKHVKKIDNYLILNQYDDEWYSYTFKDPAIKDFDSFFKIKIKPYFSIINL